MAKAKLTPKKAAKKAAPRTQTKVKASAKLKPKTKPTGGKKPKFGSVKPKTSGGGGG